MRYREGSVKINRKQLLLWSTLSAILLLSFCIHIAGIQRKESVDYHPDEWVLAKPIYEIANEGQVGIKTHYKWSGCGFIYPVGYTLYFLKPIFKEYSYETILRILRCLSAVASVATILIVFLFLRCYHSIRAAYIGAVLLSISPLPVIVGHYATLDSITVLIAMAVLFVSYQFFNLPDESHKTPIIKSFLLGALIGWGIAVKWTLMLSAIPLFIAFVSAFVSAVRKRKKKLFITAGIRKCVLLGFGLILGFLVFFPDVQFVPNKVKDGLDYEIKHHQTGHYGTVLSSSNKLDKKLQRTYRNFVECGWKIIATVGLCSLVFVFFKRNPLKWYLFFVFLLWTYIPFRNLVSPARHYLVPYVFLLLLLSLLLDYLLSYRNRYFLAAMYITGCATILISLLYTCVCISTFWQEDPRITCTKWMMENIPEGSGVIWAPRTTNWMVPGVRIAPSLFKQFPRQPENGKDLYFLVSPSTASIFKKHPPTKKIVPSEWFPSQPPSQQELLFYYEVNQGGGLNIELVKKFFPTPRFLGLTLKAFFEYPHTDTTYASRSVYLFKLKIPPAKQ